MDAISLPKLSRPDLPELLSLSDVARLLHVPVPAVEDAIGSLELPLRLVAGRPMVPTRELFAEFGVHLVSSHQNPLDHAEGERA